MPEKESEDGASKDESAVNHEIATLLLNLASRTTHSASRTTHSASRTNHCASRTTHSTEALKKTSMKAEPEVAMDLSNYSKSSPKLVSPTQVVGSSNPYSLFTVPPSSSHPTSLPSSLPALGSLPSSYLLQNLLIGKMQQQLSCSSDRVTTTSSSSSSASSNTSQPENSKTTSSSSKLNSKPSNAHCNIPLLSGQIVAQLNALLFSIHGLTDKNIETKVEGQLSAIFSRLQEIVTLVQITKQGKEDKGGKDDHKRQLEDYQTVMVHSNGKAGRLSSSLSPSEPPKLELSSAVLRGGPPFSKEYMLTDSSPLHSRKFGGGRDGFSDCSPPEKRSRQSPDNCSSSGHTAGSRKTSKGGKGIRNRVFCGDCPGCLKNDDCGQCRYCRDKTKFGGQNRLRQKCLHRRCQMDTHRRSAQPVSASNGGDSTAVYATGEPIYSGLELARLANHAEQEEKISSFSSLLGSSPVAGNGHLSSPEPEGSQNSHQSRIDKWKAKHQAMLKMAEEGRDQASPSPPPEQSKLVIRLEKEDEDEEEEEEGIKENTRFHSRTLNTALVV